MRRATLALLCLTPFAVSLAACGGGSSSAGSCQGLRAPTAGPGDTLGYFPAEPGRSWQYQQASGGTVSVSVTGTQVVAGETVSVFTTSSTTDPAPSSEWLVKRPWGAYVLDDGSSEPLTARLYPDLIMPFPVQPSATAELARCTNIDVGDLDGDGRSDRADLVETFSVVSITETALVPAGDFVDVAHLRKDLQVTARSSSSGALTAQASEDAWYAPGVGRVVAQRTMAIVGGPSESDSISLTSYGLPAPRLAPAGPAPAVTSPPARVAARPDEPASFGAATRRLAASIMGWPR